MVRDAPDANHMPDADDTRYRERLAGIAAGSRPPTSSSYKLDRLLELRAVIDVAAPRTRQFETRWPDLGRAQRPVPSDLAVSWATPRLRAEHSLNAASCRCDNTRPSRIARVASSAP